MFNKQQEINSLFSKLNTISMQGRLNTDNQEDFQRYKELADTVRELVEKTSYFLMPTVNVHPKKINDFVTPKIRLRTIIFKDDKLLLIHKKDKQHGWALPGGWASIGYSVRENIITKVNHETGIIVDPSRIIAIKDISKHAYKPVNLEKAYKIFVEANIIEIPENSEEQVAQLQFFTKEEALAAKLSPSETLPEDIEMAFAAHNNEKWETLFD